MVVVNTKALVCNWCGSKLAYKCISCGRRACLDCTLFPLEDTCVHKKYEKVESDGWHPPY